MVVLKEMGKSSAEIARALKITASTVATLYHRARSKGYEVVIVLPGDVMGIFGGEDDNDKEESEKST